MSNDQKKPDIWEGVYEKQHCQHCYNKGYRQGFFDAGTTSLMIIIVLILAYGIEITK